MSLRHGLLLLMFVILSPIPLLLRAEVIPATGLPIVLTGSGNSLPTHVPADRAPASTYRMKLIKVFDREGWSQPVEAYRILIPSDWNVDGWAHWRQGSIGCPDNIVDAGLRAVAPD